MEREEICFFVYTVFWKEEQNLKSKLWCRKIFFSFKEAKIFAKSKKDKKIDLLPYILKTAEIRWVTANHREYEIVPSKTWEKKGMTSTEFAETYCKVYRV